MTKLMKVPYFPTEADLSALPRVVSSAIVNNNRAFSYYSKHVKMMKFYRAINGTGMKAEDAIAMQKAIVNKNRAESEMWEAFDLKEKTVKEFNSDPDKFWQDEHAADCDAVIDGLHYEDICAEMRMGI